MALCKAKGKLGVVAWSVNSASPPNIIFFYENMSIHLDVLLREGWEGWGERG